MKKSKKLKILVTGVGGDIGWNIVRCLMDTSYNIDLLGCDIDPYAAGRKLVKKFLTAPMATNDKEYRSFMTSVIKQYKIQYIYPSSEAELEFFNCNRETFEQSTVIFINNPFIMDTFSDKYETINFLKKNDFPYPTTYLVEDYENQLDFPFLIKARRSSGSKSVLKIRDQEEFEFYRKRVTDAIIQEHIGTEDEEYTAGIFSDGHSVYSICFRRYLGYSGLTKFAELIYDDKIRVLVEKIAKVCQLEGSMNVQLRKTTNSYIPFEINPRISSTVYFRHCFGFKDVKWWLDLKENKKIEYKLKYQKGIGIRTVGEVFFDLKK